MSNLSLHLNIIWIVIAAAMFFLIQAGFTTLEAGLVRAKNSINVIMKNTICVTLLIYPVFGHWAWGNLFNSDQHD
jgi:Amt family ammonium transporter